MPDTPSIGSLDGEPVGVSLEEASDASLVVAVGRWRHDALAEIYRRHAGACFGLARRVAGNQGVAEEVVQDVFVNLWRRPERFDPERGALRSFLLSQVHGRAVDRVRSDVARERRERKVSGHEVSSYDLEREVVDLAVAEQVRAVIQELPDQERRALELAYFGGHTYREVAALLDQPEGTVKSRIRSGLRRLKDRLSGSGVHNELVIDP